MEISKIIILHYICLVYNLHLKTVSAICMSIREYQDTDFLILKKFRILILPNVYV